MLFNLVTIYNTLYQGAKDLLLGPVLELLKDWWWFLLPFILVKRFKMFWRWWRFETWLNTVYNPILFEIRIPKEITKPVKAMDDVMTSLHGVIYHPPDWWEYWVEGQAQTGLGFEMISVEGKIHFYIRVHEGYVDAVHAAIYSQYPEVEIEEVDDYTKKVPQDIPNKDWDLWGSDYRLHVDNAFPIRTYKYFETGEEEEERKVDPVSSLLESLAKIGPGEQLWIQFGATPVAYDPNTHESSTWVQDAAKVRDQLAKREPAEESKFRKPMILQALEALIEGKPLEGPEEKKSEFFLPPELKLTPGEREIVQRVEEKMAKRGFVCRARFIYLGKREVFVKAKLRLAFNYFASYFAENLNGLRPEGSTISKIHKSWFLPLNLLRPRRTYLRKRKIFRNYVDRVSPYFPLNSKLTFILNTEELASLYHFPSWRVSPVPGVRRIEARRKPPAELPEE